MSIPITTEPTPTPEPAVEPVPAKETDWKVEARKWEDRAKENFAKATAGDDAIKRLAEIEEANKTEAEKVAERLEAAEKRASELEAKATRAEVAAAKGVPANLLSGSTQAELEASADALIAFRGTKADTRLVVPSEGGSTPPALNSDALEDALKSALGIG